MLLKHENPRLFTNNDIWTCTNRNQIKMKPKTSTQDHSSYEHEEHEPKLPKKPTMHCQT